MPKVINMASIFLELFPFDTFSCPDDIPCSTYVIVMKFHPWTEYERESNMPKVHNSGINTFRVKSLFNFFLRGE